MGIQKRGISPLLSAILLIGFVVALGAIVSTFLIDKAEKFDPEAIIQDSVLCDDVAIAPVIIDRDKVRNWNVGELEGLGFKNKGAYTIHKLTITTPGTGSLEYVFRNNNQEIITLKPGEQKEMKIYLKPEVDDGVIQIKATPWVKDQEKENAPLIICTKKETRFSLKELQTTLNAG